MNQSEQINELFAALVEAHKELPVVAKNARAGKESDKFSYKYADIADIIRLCNPILAKHGLTVIHRLNFDDKVNYLETMLIHSSGQFIACKVIIVPDKEDIKGFGSAITYLRRYAYSALVGIATDEDDDAKAATGDKGYSTHKNPPQLISNLITIDQIQQLKEEVEGHPDVERAVLDGFGIDSFRKIPHDKFNATFKRVREMVAVKSSK